MKFNIKLFTTLVVTYRVFIFQTKTTSDTNNYYKNVYTQLGFNTIQYKYITVFVL